MNFGLSEEQEMIVETVRAFVETEIYPHENEVERSGIVPPELGDEIRRKCIDLGFYACNFPEEVGGAGLDHVTFTLVERELGRGSLGLTVFFGRPSGILMACEGEQRERYLLPAVRGEKIDALAITEPDAGSDMRGMKCAARRDGSDFVLNGTKHFISHADVADFVIVFAATGEEETPKGIKKKITAFLVDRGTPGFEILKGYDSVSHRGYHNSTLNFTDCRIPEAQVLGEVHRGFDIANQWLYGTRLTVAATCVGRARRVFDLALPYAAERKQFGKPIGANQGVSFKLADMITEIDAADWLTLAAAWQVDAGRPADRQIASAKLYASEMLARVTDEAIQIFGGMGLMDDLPLARFWRDARVERIWDGTSEIQRHIISRDLLRPLGA
ncbi:acyl-CoA dehydrogenase family protein [Rhizobium ruizarguesonis]|uniref:acyl-CoA dehydrogenase family protein n=1 Tax=Rhizobium ruizarguesonis TaxID=2081791 RepID=UPI0004249A50|nr:acyl-CoA dehydrogenase family protein [Rhizobium ruizarguesonis]MBY5832830.1 acyl-CoA dehydrogenase [Rhizobium leguminosarum]QJS31705.1 acyl-CoA dehydrogenase [Rhizobium leguminosarum bv. trifolii TA1]MBC2807228.1 acyl-CoA dehydrogenase family protein [Rhizobium ruizarguesonis]MBY5849417.1 acyl-CoA dehydrogenase [Rhizobium leguminosarum]MBY5861509.1 acyl-CoA dehydrogenase [Rhizobium leguminosarum]